MNTINVHTQFDLTGPDGSKKRFTKGLHKDVSDDEADHWYVKANSEQLTAAEAEAIANEQAAQEAAFETAVDAEVRRRYEALRPEMEQAVSEEIERRDAVRQQAFETSVKAAVAEEVARLQKDAPAETKADTSKPDKAAK